MERDLEKSRAATIFQAAVNDLLLIGQPTNCFVDSAARKALIRLLATDILTNPIVRGYLMAGVPEDEKIVGIDLGKAGQLFIDGNQPGYCVPAWKLFRANDLFRKKN